MLSSVLKSKLAIQTNIQIIRVFTRLRQFLLDNSRIQHGLTEMQMLIEKIIKKQKGHDQNIELLFEYIDRLQEKENHPAPQERKRIGFRIEGKEKD